MTTDDKNTIRSDEKIVVNVYAALTASLIAQFVPLISVQIFGLVLFCLVFMGLYILRKRDKNEDGLIRDHMNFLISFGFNSSPLAA